MPVNSDDNYRLKFEIDGDPQVIVMQLCHMQCPGKLLEPLAVSLPAQVDEAILNRGLYRLTLKTNILLRRLMRGWISAVPL